MTAIEEMAGMDVLCSDKTGTLTLNKLTVDKNLVEVIYFFFFFFILIKMIALNNSFIMSLQVFAKGVEKDTVVLMAARASRLENQDAIDAAIVAMMPDPKEVLVFTSNLYTWFVFMEIYAS